MKERKNSPHYATAITQAFKDVKLNAEDLNTYIELFSGEDELAQLEVKKNQIIFGRRGTGKSHFLKAFNQKININTNTNHCSLYVSCLDFIGTKDNMESYVHEKKYRLIASLYYKSFLNHFIELMLDHKKLWKVAQNKKQVETIFEKMITEIIRGSEVVKEIIKIKEIDTTGKTKKEGSIGFSLSRFFGGGVKINSNKEKTKQEKEIVNSYYQSDFSKIRNYIDDLLKKANIERLYICIDEWSELDRTCNTPIQQYFAQKLKQTFFKSERVSVKIASIWSLTEMNSKELEGRYFGGIEIGQDIYKEFDLDTQFFKDKSSIENFLKTILYKRFIYASDKEIKEIFKKRDDFDPESLLIEEIFENEDNFKALIAASHGIPRDFLDLFDKCFRALKNNIQKHCITTDLVIDVSTDHYKSNKRNKISGNDVLISFIEIIDSYLEKANERFFILRNGDVRNSNEIKELVYHGFLHQLPSQLMDRRVRNKYKFFLIDFGCLWDWRKSRKMGYENCIISPILELSDEQIKNIEQFMLSLEDLPKMHILCKYCNRTVFVNHDVYAKHKICPHCGEYPNNK